MKLIESVLFVYISLVLLSCGSETEVHQVFDESDNLIEEFTRNTKDFSKVGLYKRFYEGSKQVAEQVNYVRDTMDGMRIFFHENGDTMRISNIKMGVLQGLHQEYYPSGKLQQKYNHVDGVIVGIFKEFYESGALKGEITFSDNNENGPFVEFHENGNKSFEGINKNGKENGELLKYDENGVLIRKMECVMGRCNTIWKKEGIED